MKTKSLMALLKEKDLAKFENFLQMMEPGSIASEDEVEFFECAPDEWKLKYLDVSYPGTQAERVMMVKGSPEVLKKSCRLWSFWEDNVKWVLVSGTHEVCKTVISSLNSRPGTEIEILMLKRNSRELLTMWLEKYECLAEDSERLLHEDSSLFILKNMYIEDQIRKMPH